jgi:hypothetical protein
MADDIVLKIATEFSDTPGPRLSNEGPFSGEEFLNKLLRPRFRDALERKCRLIVDLDGSEGYPTSFLEEAFGGLAREFDPSVVNSTITFKSEEEPHLIDELRTYIREARE